MSHELISHSEDLKKLRDKGYEIEVKNNHLLVRNIPYVDSECNIQYGTLVSELSLESSKSTKKPDTHVVFFKGGHPCHKDGSVISGIHHSQGQKDLGSGLKIDRSFSNKPEGGYIDYFEKMTSYIKIISAEAEALDPTADPRTFKVVRHEGEKDVFEYPDTNSSRAEIGAITEKLKGHKVGIVGLGGTGSYVLDLISKTPVEEIHLFDSDSFFPHNAFRAPGAASIEEVNSGMEKVEYLSNTYSKLHKNIFPNSTDVTKDNFKDLQELDFVFICIDGGKHKISMIDFLDEKGVPCIDVGMGLTSNNDTIGGIIRVTSSTKDCNQSKNPKDRISKEEGNPDDPYSTNIQIAEMNALNASLAVIKWKKIIGFYRDFEGENNSCYAIDSNDLINDKD